MEATMKGLCALRKLRQELQDDAGVEFPQAIHTEMLVLYDVCRCLDFNLFQCKAVLGEMGWRYINTYLGMHVTTIERIVDQ
ncbi:MAG: hypothetical protein R3C14_07970 [Caldilineaceae bacterium]